MTRQTEGAPSNDRDDLERITIRPTRAKKSLADVNGNGFIAEQFYTPYTLANRDGTRKFYLFSGVRRDVGTRFVAMHVDGGEHEGWRGDWIVVDPDKITSSMWEWAVV